MVEEEPGALPPLRPIEFDENIPRVDAEPGMRALDEMSSAPRGVPNFDSRTRRLIARRQSRV